MVEWQKTVIVIGGLIAIVGQFWGGSAPTNYYLPLIGGVLALIGALIK